MARGASQGSRLGLECRWELKAAWEKVVAQAVRLKAPNWYETIVAQVDKLEVFKVRIAAPSSLQGIHQANSGSCNLLLGSQAP